jgi:Transposase, Mutator family
VPSRSPASLKQDRRANAGRKGTTRAHRSSWSRRRRGPPAALDGVALIDEIVREGARRMLAEALQAEVEAYIARYAGERDEAGRRLVVRNGSHQPREVVTSAGAVEVVAPRVNDRRTDPLTGERCRFSSAILPPWCRRTPKITEVLPLLYLHGLSSGDFVPALGWHIRHCRLLRSELHYLSPVYICFCPRLERWIKGPQWSDHRLGLAVDAATGRL